MAVMEQEGTADTRSFKLYVVGETSPDSDDWSEWGRRHFVMAQDAEQARAEAGEDARCPVVEVRLDAPLYICLQDPPDPRD